MNYQQTLDYLYSQLPMFTRIGAAAFKKDLTNTIALCEALGNPEKELSCIHIAGTNGKGSTSHMLASVLQEAQYRTGLYTSPHLKDFRERIRINGNMIDEKEVIHFVNQYKPLFEIIAPSFFEWTVALCFDHFRKEEIDIAVIETGLGGRLDSTNVITPLLSVITNIGWDHMDMLGDSLAKIAFEKAGIIKRYIPVVIGETQYETEDVFLGRAIEEHSDIFFADQEVSIRNFSVRQNHINCDLYENDICMFKDIECDLGGIYQEKNLATVFSAIRQLQKQGFRITNEHIRRGIANVKRNTHLMGRWQVLNEKPLTICDTGHNQDGINYVVKQLSMQSYNSLHIVIGMVKDKDISKVLSLLPQNARYYFCNANIPRALPAEELKQQASAFGLHGETYPSVEAAYEKARINAQPDDLIYIGGSTFVVAEIL